MAHRRRALLRHTLLVTGVFSALAGVSLAADASSCPFDLTGAKADRVFFTLGMLMEHGGRGYAPPGDQLDAFYCNEKGASAVFTRVATALAREQGLPADVREETKQGCLSATYSASLAPGLKACYAPGVAAERTPRRGVRGLDLALFARSGASVAGNTLAPSDVVRRRALAYVAGAWARHRHGQVMALTAGTPKADLLATLLKALGCANVRVVTALDASPGSNTVHFDPTAEVAEWLARAW